jgi:hypothetical protein
MSEIPPTFFKFLLGIPFDPPLAGIIATTSFALLDAKSLIIFFSSFSSSNDVRSQVL